MKLALLSRGRTLYSTRRIAEVGRRRKHDVRIIDPHRCTISMAGGGELTTTREGLPFVDFDCVIPRIGGAAGRWGVALLRQLELQGIPVLNSSFGVQAAADKVRAMQELSAADIPIPVSLQAKSPEDIPDLIEQANGPPVILKLLQGTQGIGVIKSETLESTVSTLQTLWSLREEVLLQEFVAESTGVDRRVFVVDGKVVGAMERTAGEGEFRANVHRGGEARKIRLDDEARDIAVRAADALGLRVAGVDMLPSSRGPLVIEVNASPGLQGIEGATGRDIARDIIRAAESLVE